MLPLSNYKVMWLTAYTYSRVLLFSIENCGEPERKRMRLDSDGDIDFNLDHSCKV